MAQCYLAKKECPEDSTKCVLYSDGVSACSLSTVRRSSSVTISDAIALNINTSVEVVDANAARKFFYIYNGDGTNGVWLKLQADTEDDDMKGIYLPAGAKWEMPPDDIYTGKISAIAAVGTPNVYAVEY